MNLDPSKYLFLLPLFFLACSDDSDKAINKFSDPVSTHIADLKDRRMPDSLLQYFSHENPRYRLEAVEAFGSLQDTTHVDRIGRLLVMDADAGVRRAAAFALGQARHPSCERLLLGALMKEQNPGNSFEILSAYGKTTRLWKLDPDPFLTDSNRTAGLAWSIYRAGLRGKTDSQANAVAISLLKQTFTEFTRLGAAHFFARGAISFEDAAPAIISVALNDPSADVRMAAALSLGKIPSDTVLHTLTTIIDKDPDHRVIINAVRALKSFPLASAKATLFKCLQHKNANVGVAASEVIRDIVPASMWIDVANEMNRVGQWRMVANLYQGVLRSSRSREIAEEIRSAYNAATDPYHRAALLGSLSDDPASFGFVEQQLREADTAVIRSVAASTLVAMNYSVNFTREYRARFAKMFQSLLESQNDPAVIGTIASALADSTLSYRTLFPDAKFLYAAREKLKVPRDIESLQSVDAAIASFENEKTPLASYIGFNHPIDWDLVRQIPDGQLATIKTSRGHIVVRLLVNEAPGSVANFVALAQQDYFDNKFVHRVVPNFVIQTGCKRGDGWGSEDYSIRSEFSPRLYRTGSMGMASAGKDTEGTQWFITHSPTPHLDGRYTLFAEVVEGMAVVNLLQIGDKITDVEVENFKAQ